MEPDDKGEPLASRPCSQAQKPSITARQLQKSDTPAVTSSDQSSSWEPKIQYIDPITTHSKALIFTQTR
ncbi:uncharacterized protein TRIVIDRAFT_110895 [Trichoderma virens Gv29-8]|uniref:Uncharacterized protein n=1 Tax=Hypocrea virens (strain Gv29-8 / FGSC 10586) TaxID=413071 RepID=G9MFP6_HYPVG|nr:uncharacterized protein TRIVIDRAFT_110895 [Trichoderma virens Gv29-8]EHK26793.1 hypothetical protein TRIVIDRAFT_110895 [Trichoderma virens Gv29-8]